MVGVWHHFFNRYCILVQKEKLLGLSYCYELRFVLTMHMADAKLIDDEESNFFFIL